MTTFPQAPLDLKVSLLLTAGRAWTDITTYAYQREGTSPPISITRGRPNESATVNPGGCQMQWNNRDGRFSPGNPTGPYYGELGRNTPVRVSVPDTNVYLRMEDDATSYISCPDSASLQLTAGLSLLMDVQLSNYMPSVLASKWGGTGLAWAWSLNGDGTLTFTWYDGSTVHQAQSTAPVPLGRVSLQVFITTGAGTVTFKTGAPGYSGMTQLGNVVGPGTATSVSAAAGQAVAVGDSATYDGTYGTHGCQGQVLTFFLQDASFTTVASGSFSSQTAGSASFTDAESNVWTLAGTAELSSRSYRFHGECSSLPVAWDPTGSDVWVPVVAGGLLRRLQQGNAPVVSAMRRAAGQQPGVVAYWPMEDLAGAATLASGLTGGKPMYITQGTPALASSTVFASSNAIPALNGAIFSGQVPAYTASATSLAFRFLTVIPNLGTENNLVSVATTGTAGRISVQCNSGSVFFTNIDAGSFFLTGNVSGLAGQPVLISAELTASGGNVTATLRVMNLAGSISSQTAASYAGTIGTVTAAYVNIADQTGGAGPLTGATPVGHVFVQSPLTALSALANPLASWAGETAGNRFARICGENGIQSRIYGYPNDTVVMGAQPVDTLPNLLQACEDADHGMTCEPRQCLGLGYRTLQSLICQTALTLSYTAAEIGDGDQGIGVTYDDQYTVNDWVITRNNGSGYEATLNDGSQMSVSAPPAGAGDYQSTKTLYLNADTQLPDAAGWMLHVSTVSEPRYPVIPLNLARTQLVNLFYNIQDAELGDYLAITSPPAWLPPGNIKQLIAGTSETLGGYFWRIAWQCVPESPYEVLQYSSASTGRWNTDGSTLATGITSGATSMSVATTGSNPPSPLWTTAGGDFPFSVIMDGEEITVTNITGSSSPQTFTITRSVNGVVKSHLAGVAVSVYPPPVWALT